MEDLEKTQNKQQDSFFNPVKVDESGKLARRMIWSTKSIEAALQGIREGRQLIANPFHEGNVKLLKANLNFQRTPEEMEEYKKCMKDVLYFASKCQLMTPEGIKPIKLRDYQEDYLRHLEKNRLSIFLSCRQSGKCQLFDTQIVIKINDKNLCHQFKKDMLKKYKIEDNIYEMPLFELYNLYDNSLKWKKEYDLYKEYNDTHNPDILNLISSLDSSEKSEEKLIKSFQLDGIEVLSESGFVPATYIHLTKPFEIYTMTTENGHELKCADEHLIFTSQMKTIWAKDLKVGQEIMTKEGPSKVLSIFKIDTKVCMCDITVDSENHSYYTNGILSHNTTTSAIFMLHYILFNYDKNALVLGNKQKTAAEIIDKIEKIYLELPYYLKGGIMKFNQGSIALDNGSRIMSEATTENSGIGFTLHCVLADEFAHIPPNITEKFYNNLFPTITAAKARFMITSTQNGYNLFQRLYSMAEMGENDYAPFKVDWWQVPEWNPDTKQWEKRDEEWHRKQVANYGSEEAFNRQFGTNFDVNTNTLIAGPYLKKVSDANIDYINKDLYIENCENFYWKPDYEPASDLRRDWIVVTIDISEGIAGDYTIFNFNKLLPNGTDEPNTETVGYFRCNNVEIAKAARLLKDIVSKYCNPNQVIISLERNTYGDLFMKYITDYIEKDGDIDRFDENMFIKNKNSHDKWIYGIQMTPKSKAIGCKLFKEKFEKGIINCLDHKYIFELQNFSDAKGNGVYKAVTGHDDLIMTHVQLALVQELNIKYKQFAMEFNFASTHNTKNNDNMIGQDLYSGLDFNNINSQNLWGYTQYQPTSNDMYSF